MQNQLENRLLIYDEWKSASSRATIDVVNPTTEEVVTQAAIAGPAEIGQAFDAAATALPAWSRTTAYQRGNILKKAADLMRQRADVIAKTMTTEQGKPVAEARGE